MLVFKTSVTQPKEIRRLRPVLDTLIESGDYWNFDLEDCDHILRVETRVLEAVRISAALQQRGFDCEEL